MLNLQYNNCYRLKKYYNKNYNGQNKNADTLNNAFEAINTKNLLNDKKNGINVNVQISELSPWTTFPSLYNTNYKFKIDEKELRNDYINIMRHIHPDIQYKNNSNGTGSDNSLSELINKIQIMYKNVINPITRAELLLEIQFKEHAINESTNFKDIDSLAAFLEGQTLVENTNKLDELIELKKVWDNQLAKLLEELNIKFDKLNNNDNQTASFKDEIKNSIREIIIKCKFTAKVINAIENKLIKMNYTQ